MLVLFCLVSILILPFKSRSRLEAENVALRHQVMVLRLNNADKVFGTPAPLGHRCQSAPRQPVISARRTFKGPLVVIDLFGRFDVREKHLLCACRERFFLSC
jgi:hypothetical protein